MSILTTMRIRVHTFLMRFKKSPQKKFVNPYAVKDTFKPTSNFVNPFAPKAPVKKTGLMKYIREVVSEDTCWFSLRTSQIIAERKEKERKAKADKETYELFINSCEKR